MGKYKKICYSILLTIAVFTGTFTASTFKAHASSISLLPVLTSSTYNNKNIFTISGYKGQCTWFTYGRVLEKLGIKLPSEFYGNATTWWNRNITDKVYNYGSEPKANSIIVWSGGSSGNGHVGFVEKVEGDLVYFNEANFSIKGSYEGHLEVLTKKSIENRGNVFLKGYIYPTEKCSNLLYGQVTLANASSKLSVRSGASTSFSILGYLSNETNVTILEKCGSWYKVQYANAIGYISASYVKIVPASVQASKLGTVKLASNTSKLNVRISPSGTVINTLNNASNVTILGQSSNFYKIKYGNITGYVSINYVALS